jgi:spermidine synthase
MSLEIIGGRLLSPFFGNSVYVWGSIISVFLIALSSGYYLGGTIADKKPFITVLMGVLTLSGLLMLFIPLLAEPVAYITFQLGLGNAGALAASILLFSLPSLGLAMVSPYVVRLGIQETDGLGNLVGKFSAVSTLGSIIGTLVTTFVLIPLFGIRDVIYTMGVALVMLSVVVLLIQKAWYRAITAGILVLAVLMSISLLTPVLAQDQDNYKVIVKKETMYNNLTVADSGDNRYLLFNGAQQTGMKKSNPTAHLWFYTEAMTEAVFNYRPRAEHVLLIGLGGGTIPKSILAKNQNINIDAIDIDPEVIRAAEMYFNLPKNNSRLHTEAVDGRMFLRGKKNLYDVILIDAYNRLSIPYHLTTQEFFQELLAALKPGGVVVFNVVSSIEGEYSPFFKSLLQTTQQVFQERQLFQTETLDPRELANLVLVVSQEKLASTEQLAGCPQYKSPIDLAGALVLTDDYAPVEALAVKIMTKI